MAENNNNNQQEEVKEKKHLFAETSVAGTATNYAFNPTKYSASSVVSLLEDPQKNAASLQEVSLWLYYNSGIYYVYCNDCIQVS
mgnify:CR=1 FL=1